ncbi:unknown [Crocosphaera subtropica ATCC 51142]|uniref:Nuclease SbcCD subunit C n=1 Tax=Crocosphaera subtropica (strain ATCC 51142 / BH68) TaxID=43989 RepID=B1WY73_CROS5|nr:AAA family ATPase [Crocosphaera subtropica]ACB52657.1 unknown [Crocosphaera subtropica ATCC 51142]
MKLLSIKLCNFRQFYGQTPEISLACGKENTTIIHGNNGSGKTTLLNAFTWVLYEEFTAAFTSPELLINKRAIMQADIGTSVECWVEIYFEHEHKHYQVKRKCYACLDKNGTIQYSENKFYMLVAEEDGRWYPPSQQPDDIINRILPKSLHQYFFFDGEHIDHIFRSNDKSRIAEDTKELLGVKVLDRSIEHLKKAEKTLEEELKIIGDVNIKKKIKDKIKLEQEQEKLQNKKKNIIETINSQELQQKEISENLITLSSNEQLKNLKIKLEKQESNLRKEIRELKRQIKQFISNQGYLIFLGNVIPKFNTIITNLRQRGELPSGIKQQFVQQLLNRKSCICGQELIEGNHYYEQVKQWMDKAGIAAIEESAIRLESQVNEMEEKVITFWENVDEKQAKLEQSRLELSRVEVELDDINQKFRNYPDADIRNLQENLDKINQIIRELQLEQGGIQQQLTTLQKQIETLDKDIAKQKLKEEKQILAKRRSEAAKESRERLIEVRIRLEKQFRLSLEKRVQAIFCDISFTPYIPRLTQNYELNLIENTSGIAVPVAASTGENQILSLSFIGGIIDSVRNWSHKNTLMGPDSSTFPVVMDSPFGSLDEIYRRQVAKSIPKLANQLIILVTKTQWRGEVQAETNNYIGKEYVLVYYSPKPDCQQDNIFLNGVNYPLVKQSPNRHLHNLIKSRNIV